MRSRCKMLLEPSWFALRKVGLYGSLPVGQQVLVSLKGLIIGGYGMQPEIGGIYTNTKTGAQSIGSMTRYICGNLTTNSLERLTRKG